MVSMVLFIVLSLTIWVTLVISVFNSSVGTVSVNPLFFKFPITSGNNGIADHGIYITYVTNIYIYVKVFKLLKMIYKLILKIFFRSLLSIFLIYLH